MIGATLTVVGFMLQKQSHTCSEAEQDPCLRHCATGAADHVLRTGGADDAAVQCYWLQWRWQLGLLIWLIGQAVCWAGDGLANKSLLACFNCWNILVVFVLAPLCLGEAIGRRMLACAALTLGGCVWVVLTGPKTYHEQTVETLQSEWSRLPVLCLAAASTLAALMLWSCLQCRRVEPSVSPGLFAALSAILAWYAVLLSKCASVLVVSTLHTQNQLGSWHVWAFAIATVAFTVCQMHTLNMGLKYGEAVFVLPVYEATSMSGQVVICGVFFGEFRGLAVGELLLFCCGLLCVLCGVVAMVRAGRSASSPEAAGMCEERAT